ncbi:MAG TPA: phosphotyrosine protein phosphatase, partial [Phycisphaerales bacterium]|nr:phosphotyrosine protein phosphatase [Phycisphaerales bacterium]
MSDRSEPTSILFICLGNICRSPLAEGIFTHLVEQRGLSDRFHIDSCGTGDWHIGKSPDARA